MSNEQLYKHTHTLWYLVGSSGISGGVRAKVGEFLFEFVMRAVTQTVDHAGRQQHSSDADDGNHSQNQKLHRFRATVLGGNLIQFTPLERKRKMR